MREIKFRAWDTKIKCLMDWETLCVSYAKYLNVLFGKNNLVLMQFTGLKDRNGKEIYEGDVVSKTRSIQGDCVGEVVYRSSEYMMRHSFSKIVIHDSFPPAHECPYYLEVIGNVYQNPELIKKESL